MTPTPNPAAPTMQRWPQAIVLTPLIAAAILLATLAASPLRVPQQLAFALVVIAAALWLNRTRTRHPDTRLATLTLVLLSTFSTLRYAALRFSSTWSFSKAHRTADLLFIALLLLAETHAFLTLFLGFFQTVWPLDRPAIPLPDDTSLWPSIDLFIPTFEEPLSLVRFTALAALNIDWPLDKLNVILLDDGHREDFRRFAEEAGIGYLAREGTAHTHAGNINHALRQTHSPYVAIFHADHVPTRAFLQLTVGAFLRDPRLAILQTPQLFYSPDPFERNLDLFRVVPSESDLFFSVLEPGNDLWNASLFSGSCAVLRREALDQTAGLATDTLAEDAHTTLRLQMRGWNTAYLNIPQSAGLATSRLSAHIRRRIRCARGMMRILRIDNPLTAPSLSLPQRLCFFSAIWHVCGALPRLIFLTAPLVYLLFGRSVIAGPWPLLLAYALPHLLLAILAKARIHGPHRQSFWSLIYETVQAPYILLPSIAALFTPRASHSHAQQKAAVVRGSFFDQRIAQPFLLLLAFNLLGILMAVARLFHPPTHPSVAPTLVNLLWALFNAVILAVAASVAWESQQRRQAVRVAMAIRATVLLPNGSAVPTITADLSSGGFMVEIEPTVPLTPGDTVNLVFSSAPAGASLPATVVGIQGRLLRAQFGPLTLDQQETLTLVLYSRADSWLGWSDAFEPDRPLLSLARIVHLSGRAALQTIRGILHTLGPGTRRRAAAIAATLLLTLSLTAFAFTQRALPLLQTAASSFTPPQTPFHTLLTQFPWIVALAAVLLCRLAALLLREILTRRARVRLDPNP